MHEPGHSGRGSGGVGATVVVGLGVVGLGLGRCEVCKVILDQELLFHWRDQSYINDLTDPYLLETK